MAVLRVKSPIAEQWPVRTVVELCEMPHCSTIPLDSAILGPRGGTLMCASGNLRKNPPTLPSRTNLMA